MSAEAPRVPTVPELRRAVGSMDIYLLDQIFRGRLAPGTAILDAGCGGGRNLFYLLQAGFEVSAVDASTEAVERVRRRVAELGHPLPADRLRVEPLEKLSFPDASFDAVVASAVLHFAPDEVSFRAMVAELWRVLRPGGLFFSRLASTIGLEERVRRIEGRRFHLPDGSERFLVDEALLLALGDELAGELIDPIKTTNVQNLRAMTTWVLHKPEN